LIATAVGTYFDENSHLSREIFSVDGRFLRNITLSGFQLRLVRSAPIEHELVSGDMVLVPLRDERIPIIAEECAERISSNPNSDVHEDIPIGELFAIIVNDLERENGSGLDLISYGREDNANS
jgi:hypothetical protein